MKPKKKEVNYRFPDKCCGNCKSSRYNTYDDQICNLLDLNDSVIDIGGICDLWEIDNNICESF